MTVIFHSHKILFVCLFVLKDLKEVIVVLKKKKKSTNCSTHIVILSAKTQLETYLIPFIQLPLSTFSLYMYFLSIQMLLNIIYIILIMEQLHTWSLLFWHDLETIPPDHLTGKGGAW